MHLIFILISIFLITCSPCGAKDIPLRVVVSNKFTQKEQMLIQDAAMEWNDALDLQAFVFGGGVYYEYDSFEMYPIYEKSKKAGETDGGSCDIGINIKTLDRFERNLIEKGASLEDAYDMRNDAFLQVATHEMGHALGATGHICTQESIMYKNKNSKQPLGCIDDDAVKFVCQWLDCPETAKGTCN